MSKYNNLKILKRTKARIKHECQNCDRLINKGEFYYSLELSGKVHSPAFQRKAFCEECYQKYEEKLLNY